MSLIYITIAMVIIDIILFVLGKIIKNKKVIISGGILLGIIITFWICFVIWSMDENDREFKRKSIVENVTKEKVNLSGLSSYIGDEVSYEQTKQLLNKICEEYNMYLSNSTENGDSKGLYLYFSNDTENNLETIKNNAIIGMIKDYINTRETDSTGDFNITIGIDNDNRQYLYILKVDKHNLEGNIIEVGNNYIIVQEIEGDNKYRVNADIVANQFTNIRTNEGIRTSDIKVGDYYVLEGIIRNISEDEWKKECIKNLANCYVQGNLFCNPKEITNIQDMGDHVIITLTMTDSAITYFNSKDNKSTFELKVIAYSSLNIPTHSGGVTIYNLKEETENYMFWIGLDASTINNKYPTINDIHIYDK